MCTRRTLLPAISALGVWATAPAAASARRSLLTVEWWAPGSLTWVADLAAVLGWVALCWLLIVTALALAARVPGVAGRGAAAVARSITPRVARAAVGLAVGAAVSASTGPAFATSSDVPSLDWRAQPVSAPAVPEPITERLPAPAPARAVVVQPGDTLWAITAAALGPGATAAEIAAAWPRWHAANADVIGPDPDLLRPGQRLLPPVPSVPPIEGAAR